MALPSFYPHNALSGGVLIVLDMWTLTLLVGLLLVGLALVGTGTSNVLRALVLAMGSLGWAYRFTDNGSLFEIGQPTSLLHRTRGARSPAPTLCDVLWVGLHLGNRQKDYGRMRVGEVAERPNAAASLKSSRR
jgi:hypothetical protein